MTPTKILVLGMTGMLGSTVFRRLSEVSSLDVFGTVRSPAGTNHFPDTDPARIIANTDVTDHDSLLAAFSRSRPDVVINCVGIVKQLAIADDPLYVLPVNAMLPHRLSRLCEATAARLIHISTDCVFSGRKGMYTEQDESDASDLYGKSKYIGEISDQAHAITLRTSIIGHELASAHGLVDWMLSQTGTIRGYRKAIFSGLPTIALADVICNHVLPDPALSGLYHVASSPIDKYELLTRIARIYGKNITIDKDESVVIDRSLDAGKFHQATGYEAPGWDALITQMYNFQLQAAQ